MYFTGLGSTSRLCATVTQLSRSIVNRAALRPAPLPLGMDYASLPMHALTNVPYEVESITTPTDFLKAIGRSADTKVKMERWEEFWKLSGQSLKDSGVAVRDRRYILWCMEKYRSGSPIRSFAHEPRPKKKTRGWGPSVQNGKRIRSRRLKNKT